VPSAGRDSIEQLIEIGFLLGGDFELEHIAAQRFHLNLML
jgi:hypothetical protein